MIQARKRAYKRWTMFGLGERDFIPQLGVAIEAGMEVISAWRPGLCVWNSFGLYGTPEQMAATEKAWTEAGIEWRNRPPRGAFGVCTDKPREKWETAQVRARLAEGSAAP